MRYLVSIRLSGFYVANLPSSTEGPLLVHREGSVLDAETEAHRLGIRIGMPLAEARSILDERGACLPWDEETHREAQTRWLDVAAEFSDAIEPLSQHEALVDLTGHPLPREAAERLALALSTRLNLSPKIGVARCRWVARLAARAGDPLGLAHADPESYVASLRVSELLILPADAERLERLGYRKARDVAALDVAVLRAQFDAEALPISRAAKGGGDARVRSLYPPDAIAERFAFESPPETREALTAAQRNVAERIGAGLRQRDAAGRQVDLFLEMEDASIVRRSRAFARPIATPADLDAALRLMLAEVPEHPPIAIRVRMPGLESTRRVQLDLGGVRSREDAHASARAALANVREAFGPAAVQLGSERPVPRWVRVRRAYSHVNGWAWA